MVGAGPDPTRQPQNCKPVSGYTMGYLGLKKSSGYTNMIAMLTVTVCIKLQWAQQLAHPLWAVVYHIPGALRLRCL